MKKGKISNTILSRSVHKIITKRKDSLIEKRPAVGMDCGGFKIKHENDKDTYVLTSTDNGINPVINAANNIAACAGKPVSAQISIVMPESCREIKLKNLMKDIDSDCRLAGFDISGGHTSVRGSVLKPQVSVTGIGVSDSYDLVSHKNAAPGQQVIMTKWIGIGGIQKIIDEKKEELLKRFSQDVLDKAYADRETLLIAKEAELAKQAGVTAMTDVSDGGIFAALWNFAQAAGVGLDIDFRSIPVCQEIIEICELYDINPYKLNSTGCLLMTVEYGCDIIDILNSHGISASVIGQTTAGNDKIIRNLDEVRFLDVPEPDEVYKFID